MTAELKSASGLNRREALALSGLGLIAAGAPSGISGQTARAVSGEETPVTIDQVTNVALTVSPDGKTIAFDLLGILWTIPVSGGPATRLTGYFDDLGQPYWLIGRASGREGVWQYV